MTTLPREKWGLTESADWWSAGQVLRQQIYGAATEMMLDLASVQLGSRVLDVAAGTGESTLVAARRVGRMIDRVDERVRPVAPVDAGCVDDRAVDVEALGGLDALKAHDVRSDDRPREARTTVVRQAGLEDRTRNGVSNDDGRGRGGRSHRGPCRNGEQRRSGEPECDLLHVSPLLVTARRSEGASR